MAALDVQVIMICLIVSSSSALPDQRFDSVRRSAEQRVAERKNFGLAEKAAEEMGRARSVSGLGDRDLTVKVAEAQRALLFGNQYLGLLHKPAEKDEEGRVMGSQGLDLSAVTTAGSGPDHAAVLGTRAERDDRKPVHASRRRRSDDTNGLEAVVSKQAATILQLQAKLQALTGRLDQLTAPVAASARFSRSDVSHLGQGQTLVFDHVIHNAGGGYDSSTGVFTAPRPGSYAVSLNLQRHGSDEDTVILVINKGTQSLAAAEAGYSPFEHGSMLVTTRLEQGQTISVHVAHGSMVFGSYSTVFSVFRVAP